MLLLISAAVRDVPTRVDPPLIQGLGSGLGLTLKQDRNKTGRTGGGLSRGLFLYRCVTKAETVGEYKRSKSIRCKNKRLDL